MKSSPRTAKTVATWALTVGLTAATIVPAMSAPAAASELSDLLPEGSSISAPFNAGSSMIAPWNDFIRQVLTMLHGTGLFNAPSPIPGPYFGSNGQSSSEWILDFNRRD